MVLYQIIIIFINLKIRLDVPEEKSTVFIFTTFILARLIIFFGIIGIILFYLEFYDIYKILKSIQYLFIALFLLLNLSKVTQFYISIHLYYFYGVWHI